MKKGFAQVLIPIIVSAIVSISALALFLMGQEQYVSDIQLGAPTSTSQRSIIPTTDDLYSVGSTSPQRRFQSIHIGTGSSTFAGNVGIGTTTAGTLLSINGAANINSGTSTFYSGIIVPTLTATSGLTITGGSVIASNIGATFGSTSVGGITSANGFTLTGGCFHNGTSCLGAGVSGSGADTRVAFWNGASSLSSNANFLWANTPERLTVTLSSTTDSASIGNLLNVSGAGTSTFAGGVSAAIGGLSSINGLTLTGGQLLASNLKGLFGPLSWTFGSSTDSLSVGNVLDIDGTGTSTFDGAISALRITGTQATSSAQFGTSTPSAISSVEVKGDIFIGGGQLYSEWVPLNMGAMQTYIDCSLGSRFTGTLADAVTVIRVKNCRAGQTAILRLINNAANRAIGWSTSSPVIQNGQYASTTANAVQWFGGIMQGNFFTILAATTSNQTCGIGC